MSETMNSTEEVKVTDAEVVESNDSELQKRMKTVSEEVQKILEAGGMALQPFLVRSEYGDRPSVRLVSVETSKEPLPDVTPESNDDQTTNTRQEEVSGNTDESAPTTQS